MILLDAIGIEAKALRDRLRDGGRRLAVAESLTAGHIQAAIASVSGSSAYFAGGITAYSLDAKVKLLGVDRELAAECDCVSEEVARQMALGALAAFDADIAVATTGYAEPTATVNQPYAWWAIAINGKVTFAGRAQSTADRLGVQSVVTYAVLSGLNLELARNEAFLNAVS